MSDGSGLIRSVTEARKLDEARRRAAKASAKRREGEPAGVDGRARAMSAELAAAIIQRYTVGESSEKIAKDVGLGHERVYKLLRERGVLRTLSEASARREERRRLEATVDPRDEPVRRPGRENGRVPGSG